MDKLIKWAIEIQSIAQAGLAYTNNVYDIERYKRLREISAEIIKEKSNIDLENVKDLFCNETGYRTPKIDTRAALVADGNEKERQYVKLDTNSLPILLATNPEKDNYIYYMTDINKNIYIVRLSNETFRKIIEMYNEETGMLNSTYQLKGITNNIDEQTKRLAIMNSYKVVGNKEIDNNNFSEYFGDLYIEEKNVSSRTVTLYTILALTGLFFLIIAFGYLLPSILKSRKMSNNKELVEELRTELGNLTDVPYKEQHVYLTRNYVVFGTQAIKYEDIVRGYILNQRTYGIKVGENLIIQTKDGKKHVIASIITNSNILNDILKDIHSKNTNIEM
ncbi:MAG: hypothetical protein HFJ60_02330 [Clostridia bacterium]|jgi:hypothetical protein|nr:hypothetical protein [Clostridia bacterium]